MTGEAASFGLGFMSLFVHVAVTLGLLWTLRDRSPVILQLFSALIAETLFVAVGLIIDPVIDFWIGSVMIGFGAVLLLFVHSALYKSVSLRMLAALARSPDPETDIHRISEEVTRPLFADRVGVLIEMGYVCVERRCGMECYAVTEAGQHFVARLAGVQRLFGVDANGFYDSGPNNRRQRDL